jgi:2-haloacid dehalogenase
VLDVNETLSDLSPLTAAFERVGLAGAEVEAWFAGVLRDGFALASGAENPDFTELASESLRLRLLPVSGSDAEVDRAVDEVMVTFRSADVHPDVVPGLHALSAAGVRLVTLSNGASSVAEELLARAGVLDLVERRLSAADARAWKPHASAYVETLEACGVRAADAMLVAVHPWDIHGAARVGLRTGWVDRRGTRYPAYFRAPEVTASGLDTLAAALA